MRQSVKLISCLAIAITYSSARVGTRYRPAGLGDPDPLAGRDTVDSITGISDGLPEDVGSIANSAVLEIRVAGHLVSISLSNQSIPGGLPVHSDKVRSLYDNLVRAVNPRSPSIDMPNFCIHADRADHAANIVDAVGKGVRIAVLPVKILASNCDSDDPILSVCGDGIEQRLLLSLEVVGILSPHANEDSSASVDRGRNSVGEGVTVGGGVKADGGDVLREALQFVEGFGPLSSGLA